MCIAGRRDTEMFASQWCSGEGESYASKDWFEKLHLKSKGIDSYHSSC